MFFEFEVANIATQDERKRHNADDDAEVQEKPPPAPVNFFVIGRNPCDQLQQKQQQQHCVVEKLRHQDVSADQCTVHVLLQVLRIDGDGDGAHFRLVSRFCTAQETYRLMLAQQIPVNTAVAATATAAGGTVVIFTAIVRFTKMKLLDPEKEEELRQQKQRQQQEDSVVEDLLRNTEDARRKQFAWYVDYLSMGDGFLMLQPFDVDVFGAQREEELLAAMEREDDEEESVAGNKKTVGGKKKAAPKKKAATTVRRKRQDDADAENEEYAAFLRAMWPPEHFFSRQKTKQQMLLIQQQRQLHQQQAQSSSFVPTTVPEEIRFRQLVPVWQFTRGGENGERIEVDSSDDDDDDDDEIRTNALSHLQLAVIIYESPKLQQHQQHQQQSALSRGRASAAAKATSTNKLQQEMVALSQHYSQRAAVAVSAVGNGMGNSHSNNNIAASFPFLMQQQQQQPRFHIVGNLVPQLVEKNKKQQLNRNLGKNSAALLDVPVAALLGASSASSSCAAIVVAAPQPKRAGARQSVTISDPVFVVDIPATSKKTPAAKRVKKGNVVIEDSSDDDDALLVSAAAAAASRKPKQVAVAKVSAKKTTSKSSAGAKSKKIVLLDDDGTINSDQDEDNEDIPFALQRSKHTSKSVSSNKSKPTSTTKRADEDAATVNSSVASVIVGKTTTTSDHHSSAASSSSALSSASRDQLPVSVVSCGVAWTDEQLRWCAANRSMIRLNESYSAAPADIIIVDGRERPLVRSIKLLCAAATASHIVRIDWFEECMEQATSLTQSGAAATQSNVRKRLLNRAPTYPVVSAHLRDFNRDNRCDLVKFVQRVPRADREQLLAGKRIFVHNDVEPKDGKDNDIRCVVRAFGGEVVDSLNDSGAGAGAASSIIQIVTEASVKKLRGSTAAGKKDAAAAPQNLLPGTIVSNNEFYTMVLNGNTESDD